MTVSFGVDDFAERTQIEHRL